MSAAKRPLRVGGVPEHFNTPWHTAAANGRFQREAGVAVEWVEFPGGTGAMTKALRDESIDVAILLTEGIVADLHRGNPSKIVGTYVGTPLTGGVHVHGALLSVGATDGPTDGRFDPRPQNTESHVQKMRHDYLPDMRTRLSKQICKHFFAFRFRN